MISSESLVLHDPFFLKPARYSAFDKFWLARINDERDLPFVHLTLKITFTLLPVAVLLYFPLQPGLWWSLAVVHFVLNNFAFKGPFGLMLHCTSHRPWFNKKNAWLNLYLPWVVGPFFGQTPETYASHHLAMHHRENNQEEDLSSTMAYRRDSLRGFLHYFASFFFTVIPSLAWYFNKREQLALRNKVIRGELFFFAACALLWFVSWEATVAVFLLPLFISRLIMMVGNWAQHSFVDGDDPDNFYKNSITCVNTPYNHKCWNDGYHISHHIKPSLHWTMHPDHLKQNMNDYGRNKALVFSGIHFLHVWWYLMNKNYTALAKHVVNINGAFASDAEAIALMKARTRKIQREKVSAEEKVNLA